ncbi:MAG: 50S ribosomal protein L3 N(5)-glutamine methyltransferase [Rhodocyclaceae bacterium]|nr:50S ribosomal protein L3 N(5)-glutamine methyltransferase [Rhodocyclaceae bacterium]
MSAVLDELFTLRDWLRYAITRFEDAEIFYGHGTENAYDEAAWLLLGALKLPHGRLEGFLDARLTTPERQRIANLISQRITKRIPTAYLLQEAWLGDLRFYVDERVIVPRSYFAELLADTLQAWIPDTVTDVLDLCTGSGCLAIVLAHHFPDANVDAIDLSPDALAVAERNVHAYALEGQIELIESDLFDEVPERRYQLIISNPPYVTTAAMEALPPEFRREPVLALAAGDDGLDVVRQILAQADDHLTDDGIIAVEVGHNRDLVEAAFPDLPMTWLDTEHAEGKVFLVQAGDLERR